MRETIFNNFMKILSFLKSARAICLCAMLLVCSSSAFAMWYVDSNGNIYSGPDKEFFENEKEWVDWYTSLGLKPYRAPVDPVAPE